ncbi:MAG TPA: transglutaminaseTgpA domain-containing protein [Verrucomicrobiae bacterium]|nr:transglutaminaseTgpA domain-containing protein [Verrucomicrobiae bacterium]
MLSADAALAGLIGLCGLGALAALRAGRPSGADRIAAAVTLALALALALAVAASLAGTVLRGHGPGAGLAAAIGVLAVAATAAWRRRAAAAALALVPMTAAALLLAPALPGASGAGLGALLGGGHPVPAQAYGLELLCLAVGGWVGWWAVRDRRGLVAAGAAAVVVVADLVNVPGGRVAAAFWPVCGAVAAGLTLVGWSHAERVRSGWRAQQVTMLTGGRRRAGPAVTLGAIALTGAAVALPPLNLVNFSGRFFQYGAPSGSQRGPARSADVVGYSESVVPGGPLRSIQTPLLTYTTTAPGRAVYLRGVVLDRFVQGDWYPGGSSRHTAGPAPHLRRLAGRLARRGPRLRDRRTIRLTVRLLGTGPGQLVDLLYPGVPADLPASATPLVVRAQRARGGLVEVTAVQPEGGLARVAGTRPVTTLGTISTAPAAQLRRAGTRYPTFVGRDARLPASDGSQAAILRRIARGMTRGARDPYDQALDIQNALRTEESYTLSPPLTPVGTWPILYFLQVSHLGYCQYFASSMGALLRALGVPTRLVNGFGPGEEGLTPGGARLITAADAHTWVEVYFPGYGWIGFEPTPDGFYRGRGELAAVTAPPVQVHTHPIAPVGTRPNSHLRPPPRVPGRPGPSRWAARAAAAAWAVLALLVLLGVGVDQALRRRVRGPRAVRRRLTLVCWVARRERGRARTLHQLLATCADACDLAEGTRAHRALVDLVGLCDRAAFAAGVTAQVGTAEWQAAWSPVGAAYRGLLWRAWRSRHRPAPPRPAPAGTGG